MLEVLRNKTYKAPELPTNNDIIITKYEDKVTYLEDGTKQIKKVPHSVNLTKKINETKKLIKQATAEEKLAEMEKIFTK